MKIISGGQTGADRGGLEAARALGLESGGTCPRGRRAEDGRIPECYALVESGSEDDAVRTRANVEEGEATLVVVAGAGAGEGTRLTMALARELGKPLLVVETGGRREPDEEAVASLRRWLEEGAPKVLNVAGSRASEGREVEGFTRDLLVRALAPEEGGFFGLGG